MLKYYMNIMILDIFQQVLCVVQQFLASSVHIFLVRGCMEISPAIFGKKKKKKHKPFLNPIFQHYSDGDMTGLK